MQNCISSTKNFLIDNSVDLSTTEEYKKYCDEFKFEHIKQTKYGYEFPEKKYKRKISYYKQPHEIEAQIAGFKRKAKLQGRPLEDVIRDFFKKRQEILNISDKVIERMVHLLLSQII